MSYHSRCRGEITFTPPLTWQEIKNSEFLDPPGYDDIRIKVREREREIETDEGVQITVSRVGVSLITPDGDEQSFREIEEQMTRFAKAFDIGGGRAQGYIIRIGEENGDVQRYFFNSAGLFVTEEAKLRWPNGSLCNPWAAL